ncbi:MULTISPECIES: ABC transporter ATP-binding protein [unclassified Microbacterium]|uniref:ABC transporter ATP-binding protein n=1 Tax=unclassified Microbacterium TaxID=2609290 RepID=UPI0028682061|nr:ABC transporter ATP-binding protein [Microbacterium sp. Se5.02b]
MMNNSAVEITDLRVRRGVVHVFEGIDLTIPRGQITGLLGPSGCGKTTLMRSIVGVQRIAGGQVTVFGEPGGSRQLRHRVAYGTQGTAVYGDLSVRQNLTYFASLLKVPKGDVDRVIDEVGLRAQAGQLVDSLSGGQATRVSLAAALIGSPELVVLDEPTVGLDPVLRAELWALFRGLADRGSRSSCRATSWTRRCAATGCCSCEKAASSPTPRRRRCWRTPARPMRRRPS